MPFMPIRLPPGLERNGTPYDSLGSFWDMNLMRWVSGSARPLGGWTRKTEAPLGEAVRRFHAWRKNDNTLGTMVGTETKLYVDYAGDWLDITPVGIVPPTLSLVGGYGAGPYGAGTYGTPRPAGTGDIFASRYALWSFADWGEDVLLLSSEDNRLFHYVAATPDTAPIVMAEPPPSNAVGVTGERHVMVVGPTIGGTYFPHRIAWSSRESLTDWDFANPANSAGYLDLSATSPLNYIMNVKEGMLVFSSTEVFFVRYVGLPYVYGAEKIADMPVFHPYSIAAFDFGKAMWVSNRGVQVYQGGAVQTINCPIFNDIRVDFSLIYGMARTHASANGNFPEVWFFWPSLNATECDRYVIYNHAEGWWGWGSLARSAMHPSGALQRPLAGTVDGTIYEHENGWTDAGLPILGQRWLETGRWALAAASASLMCPRRCCRPRTTFTTRSSL